MLSSLTADDIYAQIVLLRDTDSRTLLLLEGETDCSAIDVHLSDKCESIPAGSKQAAIGAARLAHHRGDGAVLALVDRDWAGILEDPAPAPNVFFTDAYDMEATLFCIEELRSRVLYSMTDRRRRLAAMGDAIELAVASAVAIAALRFASQDNAWGVRVRGLPVHEIIDIAGRSIDLRKMCIIALSRSSTSVTIDVILPEVTWLKEALAHPAYCSGHDIMKALSFVVRNMLNGTVGAEHLASTFRAAFNFELLTTTAFFQEIFEWSGARRLSVWRERD